ncbi:MAG: molybdopterin cofactor-binding domain-containing protein [Burkholderiaceae bacterium]
MKAAATLDRRSFLAAGGGLIVTLALPSASLANDGPGAGLAPERLDSWLAIDAQGRVLASVGKIDAGLGIATAFAQIVADELDVTIARVQIRMGDTATTVDQRGTGSSNGITDGGAALRTAAAQARAFLVAQAAVKLGVPADRLEVVDGVVRVPGEPARSVAYAELLRDGRFEIGVDPKAKPGFKDPKQYRYVGQPVPRADIAAKATAQYRYLVDYRVPGMVHARVLRPPTAGATLLGVERAPQGPGFIKLVTLGNFAAVVCEREEQAVQAAREVRLKWSEPGFVFSRDYDALYDTLRSAPAKSSKVERSAGDVDAALASAARRIEAEYAYPFQSHACMGPACALAQITPDQVTVWMGGQKPYPLRHTVAELLGRPLAQVRVVWLPGSGSYGMNDADDAAVDATLIAREVGRPVRLQYARSDATAWDPKGPPGVFKLRGGLDADGKVTAFDYRSRGYSGRTRPSGTERYGDSLASQLIGGHVTKGSDLYQVSGESYGFANRRVAGDLIAWEGSLATGLRTGHLRDPDGMATCFASESFIDELALAAKADPVEFRLANLTDARHRAVVRAAADKARWQARVGPTPDAGGAMLTGRGIAYAPRNGAVVAMVAEVEVERATGLWRATRFVVAHDCGMVVNPRSLDGVIESNILMSLSRSRHEEVRFDARSVLSVDWASYPILDMTEVPDAIEVVLVGNLPGRSYGAGEPSTRPVAAALANALFDATGRRLRRVPLTPERLLAAMKSPAASVV